MQTIHWSLYKLGGKVTQQQHLLLLHVWITTISADSIGVSESDLRCILAARLADELSVKDK